MKSHRHPRLAAQPASSDPWVDTRLVRFDDTIVFGHGGFDFDAWESLRWEMHTPQGSFAVWKSGKSRWSVYGGPFGIMALDRYSSEAQAKADAEQIALSLANSPQPAFDHRALAVEIVQAMDSKDWIFNKQRQCIDGVEQILRKASGVGYVSDLEKQMLNIIDERDFAEAALGRAYRLVMGREPKWSECFGYDDALREIDTAVNTPEPPAPDTERKLAGEREIELYRLEAENHDVAAQNYFDLAREFNVDLEACKRGYGEIWTAILDRKKSLEQRAGAAERKIARAVEAMKPAIDSLRFSVQIVERGGRAVVDYREFLALLEKLDSALADIGTAPVERKLDFPWEECAKDLERKLAVAEMERDQNQRLFDSVSERLARAVGALEELVEAVTPVVNEKGAGGYLLARLSDARSMLADIGTAPAGVEGETSKAHRKDWSNPTQEMLDEPLFEAIWQCIKSWDVNVPQAYSGYCGATGNHVRAIFDAVRADVAAWATERWNAEVANRPLQNIHRRSLDDTWRQVIRHFGGDPEALCGPAHDDLLATAPRQAQSFRKDAI